MSAHAALLSAFAMLGIGLLTQPTALNPRIGPAKVNLYAGIRDADEWRNPYLVIHADKIELIINRQRDRERREIDVAGLQQALIGLPVAAWPYGRVVAMSDIGLVDQKAAIDLITNTRREAARILERLGVTIESWPA
jgi:hypothetical protein